jgi:glycosyltransferase involved in cell wall biosynthesis
MNSNYSGVGWYTYNVLENLFKLDHENEYILFYNSSKKVELPKFKGENITYKGFHYPNKIFSILNYFNLVNLEKMIGAVDIFWSPNLNFISWPKKAKKILTIHDLSFLIFPEFFSFKTLWWHKLILGKILKDVDLIVTDSKSTKSDLIRLLKISEEKIRVVYLGVTNIYKVYDENDERLISVAKKYNLPENFIFFVGAFEPRKNIESIVESFRLLEGDMTLIIAGASGWKNEGIHKLVQGDNRIRLLGYIDEEDKPALYNLANFLIYPSHYEGFGLPLIEAMACGCPVIAGANSSQLEVVGEAGLLVDPNNLNEIKVAMENMMGDSELRNRYIKLGLERAKEFSWHKTAEDIINIFK